MAATHQRCTLSGGPLLSSDPQTNIRQEVIAGTTTFFAMAYILAVNPAILSNAIFVKESGDLFGPLMIATAVSAAVATFVMGAWAKYPFALAPGMGLNAYFAFTVVLGLGIPWRVALAAVLVEGLLFIALTLTNVRSAIVTAIPASLKHATAAGIGLFIAYIALSSDTATGGCGIIAASAATKTTLGNILHPNAIITLVGLVLTGVFVVRRMPGGLLMGVLCTAMLGWFSGVSPWPTAVVQTPAWPGELAGQALFSLDELFSLDITTLLTVVLVMLFVDLFDTVGTLAGLGAKAGFIDQAGQLPRSNRAFMADAIGTTVGALLGTSTVTSYIESAAGITEGGRTGLTAIVVAVLFLLSIFFIPLLAAIPAYATAPALVIVGMLMMSSVLQIDWNDPAESLPAFLTIIFMPLCYSIAEGLAIGMITWPILKTVQGKFRDTNLLLWILAGLFVARFALLK